MTVDPINKKEKLFPTYSGSNDNLLALLNKTSEIICKWFSDAEKIGPLPIDINFKCSVPDEFGNPTDILFSEIESLIYTWELQVGRSPTKEDIKNIIDDVIKEEILYREALRLNLDLEDRIIKRRLAQKISFLREETSVAPPDLAELQTFFEKNLNDYVYPEKYTFTNYYFSSDRNGKQRAQEAMKIIEDNNIEADDESVKVVIDTIAGSYENADNVVDYYMNDPQKLSEVKMMVVEDKVVDWLYQQIEVNTVNATFSEVMNRNNVA